MSESIYKKEELGINFWVGLFVLAGLLCSAYLGINIAGMKLSDRGYHEIIAKFSDVSGLKLGASVEIAGVQIGEVKSVNLDKTMALVTLLINDDFKLREDDIAQVRTKGIIGDKYVRISPGGSDEILKAGDRLSDTEPSVDFEAIIGKFIHSLGKKDGDNKDDSAKEGDKNAK